MERFISSILTTKESEGSSILPSRDSSESFRQGYVNYSGRMSSIEAPEELSLEASSAVEEIEILKPRAIGESASIDEHEDRWKENFDALRAYRLQYGNCRVPSIYQTSGGRRLGDWVQCQRRNYRLQQEGKPGNITQERINKLNAVGFEWGRSLKERWNHRYEQLVEYKGIYGDCLVPQDFVGNDGYALGKWVDNQKQFRRRKDDGKKRATITQEQIQKLDAIGFEWSLSLKDRWEMKFQRVVEFKANNGHCRIKKRYITDDGVRLGSWFQVQKRQLSRCKPSKVTKERFAKFVSIGVWKTSAQHSSSVEAISDGEESDAIDQCIDDDDEKPEEWNLQFERYSQHSSQSTREAQRWQKQWVEEQRTQYERFLDGKVTKISLEQIEILNSVGFDWSRQTYS